MNIFSRNLCRFYYRFAFSPLLKFSSIPSKLSTLFNVSSSTHYDKSLINLVLSSTDDFIVTLSDCRDFSQNLDSNNKSFWPVIIQLSDSLNHTKLRDSIIDYVLTDKNIHTNATLLQTSEILIKQNRFDEFKQIFDVIMKRIDHSTEQIVLGPTIAKLLAQTPFWRSSLEFLSLSESLSQHHNILKLCCLSALEYDNFSDVFQCLNKLSKIGGYPHEIFFLKFFHKMYPLDETNAQNLINQLLILIHQNRWIISWEVAKSIRDWFQNSKHEQWQVTTQITIERNRLCSVCNEVLPLPDFTEFNFSQMAKEFYEKLIKGSKTEDLYLTTTPKELESFEKFLSEQITPFDCIIDFLNLMHSWNIPFQSREAGLTFSQILKQLNRDHNSRRFCLVSKSIAILRDEKFWKPIKQLGNQIGISVFSFLTEKQSNDDVYLIYMALRSGVQCYIVSNDEFKQHRFTAGPELGKKISHWQAVRQISIKTSGRRMLLKPVYCDTRLHGNVGKNWHIPYETDDHRKSYVPPNLWMCLKRINV